MGGRAVGLRDQGARSARYEAFSPIAADEPPLSLQPGPASCAASVKELPRDIVT
jgi:hypothetical protein